MGLAKNDNQLRKNETISQYHQQSYTNSLEQSNQVK